MKLDVLAFLFVAVAAEDTVTCVNPSDTWLEQDLSDGVTTSTECKTACEESFAIGGGTDNYCCASIVTDAVGDDPAVPPSCTLYTLPNSDGDLTDDIRAAETAVDGDT